MIFFKSVVAVTLLFASFFVNAEWNPTEKQYETLRNDLIAFEAIRYCPYVGINGVVTIGVGQIIGERYTTTYKGKEVFQTRLWPLKEINRVFSVAGVKKMTKSQRDEIMKLVHNTNANLRLGYKINVQNQPKRNVYCLSKTDGNKELFKLLNYSIDFQLDRMAEQAEKFDIDLASLPDEILELIFDLYYRGGAKLVLGPNTPSINNALSKHDYLTVAKEAYARSNGDEVAQNDLRNAYYTALSLKVLNFYDKLKFKDFIIQNKKAKEVEKRIQRVIDKSPDSVPEHAKETIVALAIHKNVLLK